MRRLMMVALVAGTAALTADVTPAAACGYGYGYGYGGCGCYGYAPAYYYRPVYAYRPVAYAAFYRPRVWGWGYGGWGRGWRRW